MSIDEMRVTRSSTTKTTYDLYINRSDLLDILRNKLGIAVPADAMVVFLMPYSGDFSREDEVDLGEQGGGLHVRWHDDEERSSERLPIIDSADKGEKPCS